MKYEDQLVRVTATYEQYPELYKYFGKAGMVIGDLNDGTVIVHFKGRKRVRIAADALTIVEI